MTTSRIVKSLAAVALVTSAVMFTTSTDADVSPAAVATVNEDEPGWNCFTMGNKVCGPAFVPVSQELADALSEGDTAPRDWSVCLVDVVGVVCPDGFTQVLS